MKKNFVYFVYKYKEKQRVLIKRVPVHKEAVQYVLFLQHCMT